MRAPMRAPDAKAAPVSRGRLEAQAECALAFELLLDHRLAVTLLDHDLLAIAIVARVAKAFVPAAIVMQHDLLYVAMTPAFMAAAVMMTLADFYLDLRVLSERGCRERRRAKRQSSRRSGRESKHSHGSLLGTRSADGSGSFAGFNAGNGDAFPGTFAK